MARYDNDNVRDDEDRCRVCGYDGDYGCEHIRDALGLA